ncbi:MAG: hypothetical protein H6993_03650 [Pseudomonadales bacterium]|nr:hypothetical protein [Pseudomonadales bacterium]MCP5183028.1 hypothetical protein [Pseudomonadales bacterium]
MQPLIDLVASFRLYAVCIPCGRMHALDVPALIRQLGPDACVTDVRLRVRCRRCGLRTRDVRVVYMGAGEEASGFAYRR